MRTRAYGDAERTIAAADTNTIRERWLYGLRLIHDPDAIAPAGGLKHGVAEQLVEAARRRGIKISATEIRDRMQAARAYRKESQIARVAGDFSSWEALRIARFPAYEADPDEPDADWRTPTERKRDRAHDLLPGPDGTVQADLFADFEYDVPLKDLVVYAEEQAELTARFAKRDAERAEYLARLRDAVDDDLSVSWRDAHRAAFGTDESDEGEDES